MPGYPTSQVQRSGFPAPDGQGPVTIWAEDLATPPGLKPPPEDLDTRDVVLKAIEN